MKNKKEKIEVGLLYHAVRINIHNKASKEREWRSKFQFKFEHGELITFHRSLFSSDYVGHGVAPISISISQIPKLTANLKKTIG